MNDKAITSSSEKYREECNSLRELDNMLDVVLAKGRKKTSTSLFMTLLSNIMTTSVENSMT